MKCWLLNRHLLLFLLLLIFKPGSSQTQSFAKPIIDTLTSPYMHGRGYVNDGDKIAAKYISDRFEEYGLKRFISNYYQHFTFPVNTFPFPQHIVIDGSVLVPGEDYIPEPSCTSVKDTCKLFYFDKRILHSKRKLKRLNSRDFTNTVIVIDPLGFDEKKNKSSKKINELTDLIKAQAFNNKATILIKDKLTWSVAGFEGLPVIHVLRDKISSASKEIELGITNQFIPEYKTQNVIGYIPGTLYPDSFIVFSAHYDHLGRLGPDTYFPGANDNASGVSMLLNLANHYSKPENKPPVSIAFIAFGAEEAGLLGSAYYTEHSFFPLSNIKFLLNLDLLGTGEEGITVVNGAELKKEFEALGKINSEKNLLKEIRPRGKAANSDHYHFTEKGVKAFFIYTMGGIKAYHDVYDRAETLPLTEYEDIFTLINDFTKYITAQ